MTNKSMKIVVVCLGSRGDVQPYIALGAGLKKAGHAVVLAAPSNFDELVQSMGLEFSGIKGNVQEILQSEEGHQWLEAGTSPLKFFSGMIRLSRKYFDQLAGDVARVCREAEAIIFSPLALYAHSVAEQKQIPSCIAPLQPISTTQAFASPMFPQLPLGKLYNVLTHFASRQLIWHPFRDQFNGWRRSSLGLRPYGFLGPLEEMHKQNYPALYGFSRFLIPKPQDWPAGCHITGYWFLDRPDYIPPASLMDFIKSGSPPVSVGFGSMSERNPKQLLNFIVRALRISKRRAILLSGWAEFVQENLPDDVYVIESVPHDWLFPRMAAAIHHAGAGTTAAVFRAGIPGIAIPFFGDQNYWAGLVRRSMTGPKPIPRKQLSAENLAEAIRQATSNSGMRNRAAELGQRIRSENGVATAVEILETRILH